MAFARIWKPCIWHYIYLSHSTVLSLTHNCALQVSAGKRWNWESFLCSFPMVYVEAHLNLWVSTKGHMKKLHTHQSLGSKPNVSFHLNANWRKTFSWKYSKEKWEAGKTTMLGRIAFPMNYSLMRHHSVFTIKCPKSLVFSLKVLPLIQKLCYQTCFHWFFPFGKLPHTWTSH